MDELEKKMPNDAWQKVFDEAAETPPPRVWDAIEHRLDEANDTRILPLWGAGIATSRPLVWGMSMAAAVALLLVGWWIMHSPQPKQPGIAATQPTNPMTPVAQSANETLPNSAGNPSLANQLSTVLAREQASGSANDSKIVEQATRSGNEVRQVQQSLARTAETYTSVAIAIALPDLYKQSVTVNDGIIGPSSMPASRIRAAALTDERRMASPTLSLVNTNESMATRQLRSKQLRLRGLGQIQRTVWFRPDEVFAQPEMPQAKHKTHDTWASASAMPGAFNPMVSVQAVASGFGNSYALDMRNSQFAGSTTRQPVNSRASFSMVYQAGAGVQLTDRWSLESGVGYLVGRSTVETPVQTAATSLAPANDLSTAGNLYVDALRSSSHGRDALAGTAQSQLNFTNIAANNGNYLAVQTTYSDQSRKTLTNDYQYVQVPVQVGYELRPRKRLRLAVLGGLITNIFVKNTVANNVEITAKDGVYRPIALAATVGVRVRYRPPGQWSASLAGVYQPSLSAGTRADSQVQSHPTSTGMSLGVDYHF